ncbi:7010_t:CDS:1, partial [Racocetra fulgida]
FVSYANIIETTPDDLNSEQKIDEETSCRFLEDNYDACKITLRDIIDEVGSENIKEVWRISDIHKEKRT